MTFFEFSTYLQKLEETSSRLEMTYQLADLYQHLDSKEIVSASYLMQGKLVPPYHSKEFNLSVKMVQRSLVKFVTNENESKDLFGESVNNKEADKQIVKLYKKMGDLGLVAQEVADTKKNDNEKLTVLEVFNKLEKIAEDSGEGSQERKVDALYQLLKKLEPISAKYVVRVVIGKLRLGFSTMTMIDALSWAMTGSKEESKEIESAYQKKANLGEIAREYLSVKDREKRLSRLKNISVEAGIPVVPALCSRLNSSEEIISKMGEVYAEPKFDGLRVQVHFHKKKDGYKVSAFTRNLEDVSHMFPELQQTARILKCDSCVLDTEAIGYDPKTGELVEFQKTMTRKRKHNVDKTALTVPIRFYIFDILELNNNALLDKKLRARKSLLEGLFKKNDVFFKTEYIQTDDPVKLRRFHEEQLAKGLEGAVMKKVDAPYISGRKGWSWVKIKEEEGSQGKLSDTLDLVVMGYYSGRGKRNQFGIGAVLVGVLDKNEQVKTIAKIGTGLTEDQLNEMKKLCDNNLLDEKPEYYHIHKSLIPDFFCKPDVVIEVAADEITKSPTHTAGVALRFPRMLRFRTDKSFEQITTYQELSGISHLR